MSTFEIISIVIGVLTLLATALGTIITFLSQNKRKKK